MENFIVSARKYRPSTFNSVVGQSHITNTLKNAIRNSQLAQAFLFTGPRGVGKTTCARILAKTINCMNLGEEIEPCNHCESCVSFNNSASFNIHELDAASNNSVDDIRVLVDQVRIPPQVGKYKVYIIDEVHMLSQAAFNAFLKTLEEPPPYAKFILATTEKHKIIPTILSRCQIYDFKRIGVKDIAAHLAYVAKSENVEAEEEALQIIAQKADGALRDALSIFDQLVSFTGKDLKYDHVVHNLNVLDYDYYFTISDQLNAGLLFDALLLLDKIIESGFDGQHFLTGLGSHFRDLLVCQDEKTIKLIEVGEKIQARYRKQCRELDTHYLLKALDIVQSTDFTYKSSNNKRLHLEIALMQMSNIQAAPAKAEASTQTGSQPVKKKITTDEPDKIASGGDVHPSNKAPQVQATAAPLVVKPMPVAPSVTAATPAPSPKTLSGSPEKPSIPAVNAGLSGFFPGSISIKDDIQQQKEEIDQDEVFDVESLDFQNTNEIDAERLEEVWKEFVLSISKDHPDLKSTLISATPTIGENFILNFEARNSIQKQKIEDFRAEILPFIRERLDNKYILLEVSINSEQPTDAKPISPVEKFNHLANKNPTVIELQKKFGLEPQY